MILGWPTIWLLLTYEGSNDTIWPGFPPVQEEGLDSFKFLRIFGRAARRQPQCEMREAVGHGWRESILPFVCQGRLESDVLCVILEEDWRPWQTSGNEEADPRNQDVRCCHGVIRSMVGLYNVAAQQDADCGLIRYSWEGKEGKKSVPKHGLMAVGLTVDKARQMKQAVDLVPRDLGHFDVWMLQWIRSTKPVTSVFIRPPFGGYYSMGKYLKS